MKTLKLKMNEYNYCKLFDMFDKVSSTDETRPQLSCVHIEAVNDEPEDELIKFKIVATDGRIMAMSHVWVKYEDHIKLGDKFNIIINRQLKPKRRQDYSGTNHIFNEYTFDLFEQSEHSKFPDYERVYPDISKDYEVEFLINFKFLKKLFDANKND